MTNDFDRIKERLDLLNVITQETGLKMKGHHLEECPFCHHHDCFSIKDNIYKCFSCDASGDIFTFLEIFHKLEKSEALKKAAQLAGIEIKGEKKPKDSTGVNLTIKETIFLEAAKHYHSNITNNGGKYYFLEKRKHKEEVLKDMHIGWSEGELILYLRSQGFTDEHIKASGMAKEKTIDGKHVLIDFFKKDLAIFPHLDKGKVLHFTMKDPEKKLMYQLPNEVRSKDWKFYNQAAFGKYNEIIVVEGENDLLSVLDSDIYHIIGLIGQPADYQIKALKTYCTSKHLYLWLDNDEGGKGFIRKICTSLSDSANVRIIIYEEKYKDPDEYLKAFDRDRKKEIKHLQAESVTYISWEIGEISKFENLELRLKALKERKIFSAVAEMVEAEKLVYIEKLMSLGFSRDAIEEQLEINQDLKMELKRYFEDVPKKDADPNYITSIIYKHLAQTSRFYRDSMSDVYLLHQHHIYQISNNRPFNALVKKQTGLLPTKEPGRSVWESLASEAYNSGMQIDLASWITTNRSTDTVYVNLNSPNNMILKISKDGIEEIPNGLNKEGVLLKSSKKISPVNFLPDVDIREGMQLLKELLFDNLTCEKEQKYMILCWIMSAFLLDFAPYIGLMKFSGATESGKTTAARLISLLIYGNEHLGDPSTAAAYAVSSQNPLLIIDNLESDDFTKSILKFLLLSATKGGKEKRKGGTESETTEEMPKALVLITAIEPFIRAELINRTYDIEFFLKNKTDDFIEDEIIRALIKKRDIIISSILRFIQKYIISDLDKRKEVITILKKEYRGHSKNRTDEYLATLMLTMEKLLKYIPYYEPNDFFHGVESGDKEIRKAWIEYQDIKAKDTETSSNSIIKLLDGLMREYQGKMKDLQPIDHRGYEDQVFVYIHPDYLLEVVKTKPEVVVSIDGKLIPQEEFEQEYKDEQGEFFTKATMEFVATSGEIVGAFDRFCRNNGIKNPYETASVFGSRLKNDKHLLPKGGWELITRKDKGPEYPYYTYVQGERYYKFKKVIIK